MFEDFTEEMRAGIGAEIFTRRAGPKGAPAILLLHGYPQTSAMWHAVAPELAKSYQVVCADLRGYGRSEKPATDKEHAAYSKRAMAADMAAVMQGLGHERFYLLAHDRGARVAHRLAMDVPDAIIAMTLLDIAPTREMYANTDDAFARAYWHWFYLIQPAPMPERMIGADPVAYWKNKCFDRGDEFPFAPEPLAEYLSSFSDPAAIHASCEDYRAAATIDIVHDDADGSRKMAMPVQILWGKKGVIERCFDPLALWRERGARVEGHALNTAHYVAEEDPTATLVATLAFLARHPD